MCPMYKVTPASSQYNPSGQGTSSRMGPNHEFTSSASKTQYQSRVRAQTVAWLNTYGFDNVMQSYLVSEQQRQGQMKMLSSMQSLDSTVVSSPTTDRSVSLDLFDTVDFSQKKPLSTENSQPQPSTSHQVTLRKRDRRRTPQNTPTHPQQDASILPPTSTQDSHYQYDNTSRTRSPASSSDNLNSQSASVSATAGIRKSSSPSASSAPSRRRSVSPSQAHIHISPKRSPRSRARARGRRPKRFIRLLNENASLFPRPVNGSTDSCTIADILKASERKGREMSVKRNTPQQ